jgi:hypothetical protein
MFESNKKQIQDELRSIISKFNACKKFAPEFTQE